MDKQPDVIFEENATCLTCWSSQQDQSCENEQKRMIQVNKDKKISLKKQPINHRRTEIYLPMKETSLSCNFMPSARGYENVHRTWDCHLQSAQQLPNTTTERLRYKSHIQYLSSHEQGKNLQGIQQKPDRILLTETTKLQRSVPVSQEELFKTRKNGLSQRKKSASYLYGRQSVCSFTENYDKIQRIQESQILLDYFNPNETQLREIKALMYAKQSRKSSIDYME